MIELDRSPSDLTLHLAEHRIPVRFLNAGDVVAQLRRALVGWDVVACRQGCAATVTVSGDIDGFSVASTWLEEPVVGLTSVGAACCAISDLVMAVLDANPELLCLHAAAVEVGGRLVVLSGPSHMGKSTLAARLSAEAMVFCDDMLLVDNAGHGIAVGVGPRLRLPLPDGATPAFAAHVTKHRGPADARYCYVSAPNVASLGKRAPIGSILLLDRRAGAPASLYPVAPDEAVAFLVTQAMAPNHASGEVLDRMQCIAARALCLRFVYSDLEEAVATIIGHRLNAPTFHSSALPIEHCPVVPPLDASLPVAEVADDALYMRQGDVEARRIGEALFLSRARERQVLQLNATGAAVWALLAVPVTPDDIAEILHDAFPEAQRHVIRSDVREVIGSMISCGIARAVPCTAA